MPVGVKTASDQTKPQLPAHEVDCAHVLNISSLIFLMPSDIHTRAVDDVVYVSKWVQSPLVVLSAHISSFSLQCDSTITPGPLLGLAVTFIIYKHSVVHQDYEGPWFNSNLGPSDQQLRPYRAEGGSPKC